MIFKKVLFSFILFYGAFFFCMNKGADDVGSAREELGKAIKKKDLPQVKALFEKHKIDPNQPLESGFTPLCWAAVFGAEDIVKYLVKEKKANVNRLSHESFSPAFPAASNGHLSILKYLVEEKKAVLGFFQGQSALSRATFYGKEEVVHYLVKCPGFKPYIDGAIALSVATSNKHQGIIKALHSCGVPPLPDGEVPHFFYDDKVNKVFNIKPLPLIAYTQMPVPEDSSVAKNSINIYQLKVAKQEGVSEACIQKQLKEAADKLGGSPEDHKEANPIYGGSCGYHAIKNALLGLMVLADYDQLIQSYEAGDEDKQHIALKYLQDDIESLESFKSSKDFDPITFIEKIHAKICRVLRLERFGNQFRPKAIQQGFDSERYSMVQDKIERTHDTLINSRFHIPRNSRKGKICYLGRDVIREVKSGMRLNPIFDENLYGEKLNKIIEVKQAADLLQQIALFRAQPIYSHAFVLGYNVSFEDGYQGLRDSMHAMSVILDKRGPDISVFLLESNNLPDWALKKIVFDIIEMFVDTKKYSLSDELSDMLCQTACYPFDVSIDNAQKELVPISNLIENYSQTKVDLKVKVDRDTIHKALYLFEKLKHIYIKALYLEKDGSEGAKTIVLNQFKEYGIFEETLALDKDIKAAFRQQEIALHQMFEQLEQQELDERLIRYIQTKNLTMIKEALAAGADPNLNSSNGTSILPYLANSTPEILEFFINEGYLDLETKQGEGQATLLMDALDMGNNQLVHFLLDKGADVNAKDKYGCTPLMYTVNSLEKRETIDLLVKHGADVHAVNNSGQSLADLFFKAPRIEVVEYLRDEYKVALHLKELVSDTPITLGLRSQDPFLTLDSLDFLIKHFDQELAANFELSQKLLHRVIKRHDTNMLDTFFKANLIDPNAQDQKGWTPLMHAVKARSFEIFKHLIEHYKVDTTLQNDDKETAFDIARANEQKIESFFGLLPDLPDPFLEYILETV